MDHPRLRGEHADASLEPRRHYGSSPPARGTHPNHIPETALTRIIPPARGAPKAAQLPAAANRIIPALRGEHGAAHDRPPKRCGSSPPARGARAGGGPYPRHSGIIPACAGSTTAVLRAVETKGDHPRLRGEHWAQAELTDEPPGSSPPARGALCHPDHCPSAPGIIPACAGSTSRRLPCPSRQQDHPRLRGEHGPALEEMTDEQLEAGSSPPARGAQERVMSDLARKRIIPACAGSTR